MRRCSPLDLRSSEAPARGFKPGSLAGRAQPSLPGAAACAAIVARRRRRQGLKAGPDAAVTPEQQVLVQLRTITDPGLGTDIVACGFVGAVQADVRTGRVAFGLEVGIFAEKAGQAVRALPWVRDVEVKVGPGARSGGVPPSRPGSFSRPMPQMPPSLDKVKSIVAVSSCKGGVGKSTVAVNLAFALQKTGAKVGIFDADVYGPSLPVMVRFEETPQLEMYEDEQKQKHIRPVVHGPSGIKLVSFGYAGKAAVMRGSMVTGLIAQLMTQTDWGDLDYLVLDLPPGTGDIHLTLAQVCKITAAVIVTTPQKLSVIDVERGISMFSQLEVPSVAVVQNMSYMPMPNGERQYVFGKTDAGKRIAETFGIEQVFELPLDAAISRGGDTGLPFVSVETGSSVDEVDRLAAAVVREVEKIHAGKSRPVVVYDEKANLLRVEADGEAFGIEPNVLRLRDKGAGGVTPPTPDLRPAEIRDMGNYAIVIRWSDGLVQVAPHRQLLEGDENGPMPRIAL